MGKTRTGKQIVYFAMVHHPVRGLQHVGNAYGSRKSAAGSWAPADEDRTGQRPIY